MSKEDRKKKRPDKNKRVERIREEILAAKQTAGIQPPTSIPIGEAFRSESLSRPQQAIRRELKHPELISDAGNDVIGATEFLEDRPFPPRVLGKLGGDWEGLLSDIEVQVEKFSISTSPRLLELLSQQINLASSLDPNCDRLHAVRQSLDKRLFGENDYSPQDHKQPGGTNKGGQEDGC